MIYVSECKIIFAQALSESNKGQLQQWITAFDTPSKSSCAAALLAAAGGKSDNAIAQELQPIARP
jgi:hypothetical protein